MAVIKKTLFPKNLDRYSVLVDDTEPNSKYFKITELPDTLTGGKNAFLIAGSPQLVTDTKIQIELKDSAGNIIYHEPGEGYFSSSVLDSNSKPIITEYYEGVSKVVSVYIYPDTAFGPCTLTILGELSEYEDTNGITSPVPVNWENQYNVKWTKTINVNPNLANTTKVRFYERPTAIIKEILSPIYRIENGLKVNSGVSQSFADIKLSKLETFAGDVKRIKVFRTSVGDISDYDLIQDILVESKELLTSYGLTGSVVGQTGILTSETLKSFWNTGSLNAFLTSSRVESGVRLTGSGNFTYTSSLDIKTANTYELNLDAFYSSSTDSNLGIYLSQVTTSLQNGIQIPTIISSSIGTLLGTQPTKNLLDTVIPFKIDRNYPSASLYFSQSQGEWHLGNISLKLSEDTAFSPDEISFITTMPTVIGNETFNFKFEFYDVNNNYVPVAVTQSLTFTGGINVNNTLLLVSSSTSQSLAALAAVSSSISTSVNILSGSVSGTIGSVSASVSGTIGSVSASVSGTIGSVSSSVSGTIGRVSGSISGSIYSLSGSVSSSLTLTSGSINLVSSSLLFTSQSLSSSLTTLSSSLSSSFSNASSQSAYQVYSASQYLDKFIFTDANGKLNQPPTASDPGLYLGSEYLGYYNGTGPSGWKTYMDNQGDFYLTSSTVGGGFLAWDSSTATLQIQGAINIQGGNAATTTALSSSLNAVSGAINSATSSLSTSVAATTFTTATGLIAKPPGVLVGSPSGLYLGSTNLGYYSDGVWKTYMANNGNFYLSGAGSDSLTWAGGVLTINGAINITGGNAATTSQVSAAAGNAVTSGSNAASTAQSNAQSFASTAANNAVSSGSAYASAVDAKVFTDSTGKLTKTPSTSASGLYLGSTFLGYYNGSAWKTYMSNTGNFFLSGTGTNGLSWDGTTLGITGNITVTGGNAATSTDVSTAQSTAISTAASDATTKAANAQSTAISTASGDATTKANAAQAAAIASAASDATTKANAAKAAAEAAAIAQASAYVTSLANGGWTAGDGTFITSTSISSPTIAGNAGYISGLFKVGSGGITLDGTNKKIYIGTGTFNNSNTAFYVDNNSNFSLGNKLTWDGTTLTIDGAANIGGSTASVVASGAAAGAAALQPGANISSLTNNSGYQDASSVNNAAKTAGSVGGWTINSTNLTSNNGRTVLYNTGFIELKDSAGQNKITIDSGPTLPSPSAGSDSGNVVVPAQAAQTSYYNNGAASGDNTTVVYDSNSNLYYMQWSQQVWFTPAFSGYYEFTTWFPKDARLGSTGTGYGAYQGLRAYIYTNAGVSLINDDGREYIEGPVESATLGVTQPGFAAGTYGNQYQRDGTGAYFSNQFLTAGVPVRFLIQYIVFNIPYDANLTIKAYWPATNVQYISNVPKTNINQAGFQVVQDTNRYLTIRPSGWYMYNDPAVYGATSAMTQQQLVDIGAPRYLNDQGITEVTGIMGGTMVVLNATDKQDWHSAKQKQYIRSAQFSFANRAAGGNFISSFFFGGYARSFNLTRAYGWFTPNNDTGFDEYSGQWWPYAYNIETITRITYGKFQVVFSEPIMDSYGAFYRGGIYSVFIGSRDMDGPTQFQQAGVSNIYHTGFTIDLGNETLANRFVSILVIA